MKNETKRWLEFARSNLGAAKCVLENGYFNPCLHEAQQAVEKALKAIILEKAWGFKKTHSILELRDYIRDQGAIINLDDEECAFLDSIYLPSKYPLGGVLPDGDPDMQQCLYCLGIAQRVFSEVKSELDPSEPKA